MYGDIPAEKFGPKALKTLQAHMLADRDEVDPATGKVVHRTGWCRTYANRQIKRVRLAFWAASEELEHFNFTCSGRFPERTARGRAGY